MADLDRKKVTFEQAEGLEPLPSQLRPKELTPRLRSGLWLILNDQIDRHISRIGYKLDQPWKSILHNVHVFRRALPADEYDPSPFVQKEWLKPIFFEGSYDQVLGLLQWILRDERCPRDFVQGIEAILKLNKAGYRLLDRDTIVPIGSEEEAEVGRQAFAALSSSRFAGARTHLVAAAERLSTGDAAGSVREGMQAVEAVARIITEQKTFADALKVLEKQWKIHPALKAAFSRLYGYTSDEQGIRHPLIDDANAAVDETDALFMFGACAAFVTYLIQKSQPRAAAD
jgi:hypothetical protein